MKAATTFIPIPSLFLSSDINKLGVQVLASRLPKHGTHRRAHLCSVHVHDYCDNNQVEGEELLADKGKGHYASDLPSIRTQNCIVVICMLCLLFIVFNKIMPSLLRFDTAIGKLWVVCV